MNRPSDFVRTVILTSALSPCYTCPMPTPPSTPGAPDAAFRRRHDALEASILDARARRLASKRRRAEARTCAFADLCEASEGLAVAWRRAGTPLADILAYADGDVWLLQTLARWLRLSSTQEIDRLRHTQRRPAYYEREKLRRQELAAARRAVRRRRTENPCPTKEQILDAWERAKDSNEDLIRFGSLMEDLACYVDSSLIRTEDGAIVGRRGGVKAWLQVNIPALYLKYKTVMAYKAAAKKLRQITELPEPLAVARLVEQPAETPKTEAPAGTPVEAVRARAVYLEVMGAEPPASRSALLDRIDAFTDPGRVAEATTLAAWKERYRLEITVRTKSVWQKRLWRRTG